MKGGVQITPQLSPFLSSGHLICARGISGLAELLVVFYACIPALFTSFFWVGVPCRDVEQ